MINEIFYIVGAFGCGKTTIVDGYKNQEPFEVILEDDSLLYFLKNKDLVFRCFNYTTIMWYRIYKKLLESKTDEILIVDSHPSVSLLYGQAVFEIELGKAHSILDLKQYQKFQYIMARHMKLILVDYEETFIYINLPLKLHWQMVQERYKERQKDFEEENNLDYLITVRKAFQQNIRHMAEELFDSYFVEVNKLKDIDKCIY